MILRRCGIFTLNSIFYLRRQTYKLFHGKSRASRYIELFLSLCIICNVICFLLQEEITFVHYWEGFQITQIVTTGIFALEWFLRFWSIVEKPKFKRLGGFKGRLRWSVSIESILDIISFVPFFAFYGDPQNVDGSPYSWLRALRVLTILKAGRHAAAYQVIGTIIIANKDILLASMWVSTVAFLFVAFMLYETMEGENNSLFESIPAAMFPAVLMLTGLGGYEATIYSSQAKIVAAFTMIIALAIFAVPAGIIAASYEEFFENMLEQQQRKKEKEERQRILDEEEAERDRKRALRSVESGEVDYEALPTDNYEDDEGLNQVEAIGEERKQKKPKNGKKRNDKARYDEETDDEEELEDDTDSDEESEEDSQEEDSEEGTESDSSDDEEEGIDNLLDFSRAVLSNPDLQTCICPNCGDTVKFRKD